MTLSAMAVVAPRTWSVSVQGLKTVYPRHFMTTNVSFANLEFLYQCQTFHKYIYINYIFFVEKCDALK